LRLGIAHVHLELVQRDVVATALDARALRLVAPFADRGHVAGPSAVDHGGDALRRDQALARRAREPAGERLTERREGPGRLAFAWLPPQTLPWVGAPVAAASGRGG